MKLKGLILASLTLLFASTSAHAVVFDINTCWSSCENTGNLNVTVATLEVTDDATGVDFTLTNTSSNLGTWATASTIISQLLFNYTGSETLTFSAVTGGATGTITQGDRTNASLSFNLDLDLPPPGSDYFTNGESISFSASATGGVAAGDFASPVMVHLQRLANGGSVKYVDGNGNGVPEPGVLGLLGIGLLGIVLGRRRMAA